MKLYFYRCLVCLHVSATSEEAKECFCGGELLFMGYTKRDPKVLHDHTLETPCSTLCTDAAGPMCNCACGGKHHGTGRMIEVEKTVGAAPRLKAANQKALDRAAEFLALTDAYQEKMHATFGNAYQSYQSGEWIDRSSWLRIFKTEKAFRHAKGLKVHKKRISEMKSILEIA